MKTKIFSLIFLSSLIFSLNSHASMFCGQGGLALENQYGECQVTLDTCETQQLFSQGWTPPKTGKCGPEIEFRQFCGQAGTTLINHKGFKIRTRNTCETQKLIAQGWELYQN
jgi:hypothetical protein